MKYLDWIPYDYSSYPFQSLMAELSIAAKSVRTYVRTCLPGSCSHILSVCLPVCVYYVYIYLDFYFLQSCKVLLCWVNLKCDLYGHLPMIIYAWPPQVLKEESFTFQYWADVHSWLCWRPFSTSSLCIYPLDPQEHCNRSRICLFIPWGRLSRYFLIIQWPDI